MSGKVLIVDDVATNRIVMKVKLTAAGYQPVLAADGQSCLALARQEIPDLILLDLCLPDISGFEVVERLRADPALQSVPVIVISASQDQGARVRAFRAGADEFLAKPIEDQRLLARMRSLLRGREAVAGLTPAEHGLPMLGLAEPMAGFRRPGLVALVLPRDEMALRLRRDLAARLADRLVVLTPEEALLDGGRAGAVPDVFVLGADVPVAGHGLRLMSDLRSRSNTRHAAMAVLLGPQAQVSPAMAFDLGADDLLDQAAPPEETALRLARLIRRKQAADQMRASVQDGLRLAVIDPLTGLHNRRYGLAQLQAIADRAGQTGEGFAVMVVDLDRFKSINDQWGHAAGDAVLVEVAARLRATLRAGDLLARIGGEEFLVALPAVALAEARGIAERLCLAVQDQPFALANGVALPVTASIGLAISEGVARADSVTAMFDRADRALMRSKSAGRNQVTISRTAA